MRFRPFVFVALAGAPVACAASVGSQVPARAPLATQWLERTRASYQSADFDDARESARHALEAAPNDADIRELAARVALVRLEFAEALRLTEGLTSTAAHGIRGRADWFSGDLEHAADELEAMLADPTVKDEWARGVAELARRGGGRHPFEMSGGSVGAVDMPRALDRVSLGAADVVPCEIDGERILALVATGSSEVLIDANSRREPAWVSMRFDHLEINDVPALVQDLSPIGRQLGVPIKALIGAQLLRHGHVTFDRRGDQFVVRRSDAAPPPEASRVPLYYLRGGGMLLRASIGAHDDAMIPLLVDSARPFPLLLEDAAWQRAGVDVHTLVAVPDSPNLRHGVVPTFRLGGFDLAKTPAIEKADIADINAGVDIDLGGVVGAELLAFFRVTFADEGRFMWLEPDPTMFGGAEPPPAGPPPPAAPPPVSMAQPPEGAQTP
jgi:hypothetical protein